MRRTVSLVLLFAMIVLVAAKAHAVEDSPSCVYSVAQMPVNCTGGAIALDTFDGTCRRVICQNMEDAALVLACDKPDEGAKSYFEMYQVSKTGEAVSEICLGSTCIGENGFAQGSLPSCNGTPPNGTDGNGTFAICGDALVTGDEECDTYAPAGYVCAANCTLAPAPAPVCTATVANLTATCQGGGIVDDTFRGCRSITCVNDGSSLRVFACDKPDGGEKTYFEMYKQFEIGGAPLQICLDGTCLQSKSMSGYAKADLPACNATEPPKDTSVKLDIAPWYPQGGNYVFVCGAHNFIPESFSWHFGDGSMLPHVPNTNVYHTYAPGHYNVTCSATDGMRTESDMMHIVVSAPVLD